MQSKPKVAAALLVALVALAPSSTLAQKQKQESAQPKSQAGERLEPDDRREVRQDVSESVLANRRERVGEQEAEEIPYYEQRHLIPPGLTGWAQIKYPYGASVEDARQKLQYDLFYIKNQSLVLDAVILFETVKTILFGRGT